MSRLRLVVALSALFALAVAPTALAHQGNPNYRSVIDQVSPKFPGVRLQVLNLDDRLELQNTSGKTVVVKGYQGEPYARLLGDGTVEVNHNSPAFYLNNDRTSTGKVPANGQAGRDARLADRRPRRTLPVARPPHPLDEHDHAEAGHRQDEAHEGLRLEGAAPGRRHERRGERHPVLGRHGGGGAPVGAYAGLAVIALLGLGAVLVVRRRRGSAAPVGATEAEAW